MSEALQGRLRRAAARLLGRDHGRRFIAKAYLSGHGIEVGALHRPLSLPSGVSVRYVDRMSVEELRRQYPELASEPLVHVDLIDDAQHLSKVPDSSEDFVVANHFLEHAEDPIGTIASMMRVLKPGGVLFLALPDRRYTFDKDRPPTSWEHLLADAADGGTGSHVSHYHEWVEFVDHLDGAEAPAHAADLIARDYSIHFHVWAYREMRQMIRLLGSLLGFKVQFVMRPGEEVIFVLRKLDPGAAAV